MPTYLNIRAPFYSQKELNLNTVEMIATDEDIIRSTDGIIGHD
jgi:hypothetical protein